MDDVTQLSPDGIIRAQICQAGLGGKWVHPANSHFCTGITFGLTLYICQLWVCLSGPRLSNSNQKTLPLSRSFLVFPLSHSMQKEDRKLVCGVKRMCFHLCGLMCEDHVCRFMCMDSCVRGCGLIV